MPLTLLLPISTGLSTRAPECQKLKCRLDLDGAEPFEQQQFGNSWC